MNDDFWLGALIGDASVKVQISLHVPAATVDAFDQIAEALDRDRTWVMLRAFSVRLRGEGSHILDEAEGIAQLDRGESVGGSASLTFNHDDLYDEFGLPK